MADYSQSFRIWLITVNPFACRELFFAVVSRRITIINSPWLKFFTCFMYLMIQNTLTIYPGTGAEVFHLFPVPEESGTGAEVFYLFHVAEVFHLFPVPEELSTGAEVLHLFCVPDDSEHIYYLSRFRN